LERILFQSFSPPTAATNLEKAHGSGCHCAPLPFFSTRASVENVLLVDYRDEVFARVAADLQTQGVRTARAATAADASEYYFRSAVDLVIANRELPDGSGWLMASKWCLARRPPRVWLYTPWPSPTDPPWARLARVEQVIYYGGDLFRLASRLTALLARTAR
jgi:hypothetical protein